MNLLLTFYERRCPMSSKCPRYAEPRANERFGSEVQLGHYSDLRTVLRRWHGVHDPFPDRAVRGRENEITVSRRLFDVVAYGDRRRFLPIGHRGRSSIEERREHQARVHGHRWQTRASLPQSWIRMAWRQRCNRLTTQALTKVGRVEQILQDLKLDSNRRS